MSDEQQYYFNQIKASNPSALTTQAAEGDLAALYWSMVNAGTIKSPIGAAVKNKSLAPGLRWIFIGDSITNGSSASNNLYSYGPRSVQTLGAMVARFDMFNSGVPGQASADIIARISRITASGADAAVLMIGTNDAGQGISVANYVSNVTAIVTALKAAGMPVVLCTPPARTNVAATNTLLLLRAYNTWIRLVGPTLGCVVADTYSVTVDPTTGTMLSTMDSGDGVHPNDTGHNAIAKVVMTAMLAASGFTAPTGLIKTGFATPDISNLISDPLVASGGTKPTSWFEQPGGTGTAPTYSLVSDTSGVLPAGKWAQMDFDGTSSGGLRRLATNSFDTTKWNVGDLLLMTCHIQIEDTSTTWEADVLAGTAGVSPTVVNQSGVGISSALFRTIGRKNASGFYDIGPVVWPFTVPAGTTGMNIWFGFTVPTGKHYKMRVGATGILNLTQLGLDGQFNWGGAAVNIT